MTGVLDHATRTRPTLGDICSDAGSELIDVALAPRGLEVAVGEIAFHDPLDPPGVGLAAGDLILAVGMAGTADEAGELIRAAGAAGAVAVVCRRRAQPDDSLVTAAEDAGIALLLAATDAPWAGLHDLLSTALATNHASQLPSIPGTATGDLLALADRTAAVAGGPVTIEDMHGQVLAFSGGGQELDPSRAATVLDRHIPERWMRELRRHGVFDRLIASDDVVEVQLDGAAPRRVISIRAGATAVGAIWLVSNGNGQAAAADAALRDAAQIAALHIARHRVRDDLGRRVQASMVRMLLGGEGRPHAMLKRLGLPPDGELVVVAIESGETGGGPAERNRLCDLVVAHLKAYRWHAAATVLEKRLYVLVRLEAEASLGSLRQTLEDCLARAGQALSANLRAGIGRVTAAGELTADARRGADRAIELGGASPVVMVQEVHGRALLAEVVDFLRDQDLAVSPELQALFSHDHKHGTEYVPTLRAMLEVESDAGQAAQRLGIHVNTLRYRVRRIVEITGMDLADSDARLALEMELRAQSAAR